MPPSDLKALIGVDGFRQLLVTGEYTAGDANWTREHITTAEPLYPMDIKYPGRVYAPRIRLEDRMEALLHVTAHEIAHHARWEDTRRNREARVDGMTIPLLEKFRANREALLAEWSAESATRIAKPKPTRQQRNESNARKKLSEWERKLKLAKTKVSAYRRKCRYYDRVAATKSNG